MSPLPRRERRTDEERQLVIERRLTRGALSGKSELIAPVTRAAAGVSPPRRQVDTGVVKFKIDPFQVTDTGQDTFVLTHPPIDQSWRVLLNELEHLDDGADPDVPGDYTVSITGQAVTILDPADLFGGASVGDPDTLWVEYAYLAGVPGLTPGTATSASGQFLDGISNSVTVPTTQPGDLIYVWAVACRNAPSQPAANTPAGYTPVGTNLSATSPSGRTASGSLFRKTADGTEGGTTLTVTWPSTGTVALYVVVIPPGTGQQDVQSGTSATGASWSKPTATATGAGIGIVFEANCIGGQFTDDTIWAGATEIADAGRGVTASQNAGSAVATYPMTGAGTSPAITTSRSANNTNGASVAFNVIVQ